jgi:hypothetical protein
MRLKMKVGIADKNANSIYKKANYSDDPREKDAKNQQADELVV